jgi:hypothetical protein
MEKQNNQLQVVSGNSGMQLAQQKDKYLIAAKQVIDDRSLPIANRIIEAAFEKTLVPIGDRNLPERSSKVITRLGELDMSNDDDFNFMVDLVAGWRLLLGATKETDPTVFKFEATYLVETYPLLPIAELKCAIKFLNEQLLFKLNPNYEINFSCAFMSKAISEYLSLKGKVVSEVNDVLDRQVLPAPEPSIEEQLEGLKYMIRECDAFLKNQDKGVFVFGDVYNFLRKTKRLVFNDKMIEDARKYGDKKYALWLSTQPLSLNRVSSEVKKEKDQMVREFGIYYCLMEYFNSIDLEKELAKITPEEYRKYQDERKQRMTKNINPQK